MIKGEQKTMGKRRDDEEYCPLYTCVARSRKTHASLKDRLQETPCFNCTKITDAYWGVCPVSSDNDALALPGPGVTLLPPDVDRPYHGTAYRKIWVESGAPRVIQYVDGRVYPWEWGFNPSRWGAFVEWLPLDGPFEHDMLERRVKHMTRLGATETERLLDHARRGAWMLECYLAMYFSRSYFLFPYVVCTLVLDERGRPLSHPDGGWFRMAGVDMMIAEENGADEETMMSTAEVFYDPLFHAINRTRLRVSEFK
jgi:hypothetical protein